MNTFRVISKILSRQSNRAVEGLLILILFTNLRAQAQNAQAARDADKGSQYFVNAAAAQAATEKIYAQMTSDLQTGGISAVFNNLSIYSNMVPTMTDNTYWANYVFFNLQSGATNSVYVNGPQNSIYGPATGLFAGMNTYQSVFQIFAEAKSVNDPAGAYAAGAQLTASFQYLSLFEFAVFYSGLLEFSDISTSTINGRVHANNNIYVGSPANLTFNSLVTTTGNITSPANAGYAASSWTGTVTYNGTPSPGYFTGIPAIALPFGVTTNAQQILYPPVASQNSNVVSQLYYTKANLVVMISNTTFTATFKTSATDPTPVTFTAPLNLLTNNTWLTNRAINNSNNWGTNWGWNWNWLSTTNTFYDNRQLASISVAQIDVSKLTNWMATWLAAQYNTNISSKFTGGIPLNCIYIADWRFTNNTATNLSGVRLMNGTNLPAAGLTVATPNPLYIWGNYNTPNNAFLGTTNTTLTAPASVACDALTILSPAWTDRNSTPALAINATSATVNVGIITGNVPSTGAGATQYSGGVNNLPRLLEDWTGQTVTLNTSLLCLYSSTWATRQFVLPGTYYKPPNRNYNFNQNFLSATGQPPGAPLFLLPPARAAQSYSYPPVGH